MLPASLPSYSLTIIIVPLKSLVKDLITRCRTLAIRSALWSERSPLDTALILFIIPKAIELEGFYNFINRIRVARRLDRIVINKCYIILNNGYRFRSVL